MEYNKIYKTDWLASTPVFYNEKTGKVSNNINDVIDYKNFEFHPEGLNNYLNYGYSVFGQTPIKDVKFLRHSSELNIGQDNKIKINYLADPVNEFLDRRYKEEEIFEMLSNKIRFWESFVVKNNIIIIPTSGGYDSRLLNFFIQDKSKIRSFTYGFSKNQNNSWEVVYAKKLSEILKIKWQQIKLGFFHQYFDDWDKLFGPSVHAHGMYQIEFYKNIKKELEQELESDYFLLSGIIGDVWAGNVSCGLIDKPEKLEILGYTHGMHADAKYSLLKSNNELRDKYFEENYYLLKDERWRIVEAMRFKIILLCYLLKVPSSFGFKTWSPFLDIEIALAMLNLPSYRRKSRLWQKDFFKKNGIDLENMNLKSDKRNVLNLEALNKYKLEPLKIDILKEIIHPSYIEWINKKLIKSTINQIIKNPILIFSLIPKVKGLLKKTGFIKNNFYEERIKAYMAYLTLKPLEKLIIKRNQF